LIDLGSSISFGEEELNMIHNFVTTLEPVKLAVEALCRRDATLLSADTTISIMINDLGNSDIAVQLKESLSRRMNQRRAKVSSLLQYLHKGNQTYAELELDPLLKFERLSKATIDSMVIGLSKPLDHNEPFELESDNETAEVEIEGNEFQNMFQITNDERCNGYLKKKKLLILKSKVNVELILRAVTKI
jgi:hypothetical protein